MGPTRSRPETLAQMSSNLGCGGQWVCALCFLLVFESFMFVKFRLNFNAGAFFSVEILMLAAFKICEVYILKQILKSKFQCETHFNLFTHVHRCGPPGNKQDKLIATHTRHPIGVENF